MKDVTLVCCKSLACEPFQPLYITGKPCWLLSLWFQDKVCIHQTDDELKRSGVLAIGAFLLNSKEMLILWDKTYFRSLWCPSRLELLQVLRRPVPSSRLSPQSVVSGMPRRVDEWPSLVTGWRAHGFYIHMYVYIA